jgi:hypothetical protein
VKELGVDSPVYIILGVACYKLFNRINVPRKRKMADLLNARWIEMMEKMQTDRDQENREKYIK